MPSITAATKRSPQDIPIGSRHSGERRSRLHLRLGAFCPDTLRDCLKKGVKAAIVLSAGFREYGEEGIFLRKR